MDVIFSVFTVLNIAPECHLLLEQQFKNFFCVQLLLLFFVLDINECLNFSTTDCHPNALCQNTIGSFDCQCFPGYTGNGSICSESATFMC